MPIAERLVVGLFDLGGDLAARLVVVEVREVVEHHRGAHQERKWVRGTGAGECGGRTVHGFEDCLVFPDICTGRDPESAHESCAEIGDEVPVQVLAQQENTLYENMKTMKKWVEVFSRQLKKQKPE